MRLFTEAAGRSLPPPALYSSEALTPHPWSSCWRSFANGAWPLHPRPTAPPAAAAGPIARLCMPSSPAAAASLDVQENTPSCTVLEALLESRCHLSNKPCCTFTCSRLLGWIRNKEKVVRAKVSALSTLFRWDCPQARRCPRTTTPARAKRAVLRGACQAPAKGYFILFVSLKR